MALLRLQSFPSSSHPPIEQFSSHRSIKSLSFPPSLPLSSSTSLSHHPNAHLFKTHLPISSIFRVSSSVQAQSAVETPVPQAVAEDQEEEDDVDEGSRTRLLAQNVPWSCTASDIRPLFEKYGTVVDVELSMYNKTRNRGLAFVTMGSHEEAVAALNNLESYEYEGRLLKLVWANPRKEKAPPPPVAPKQMPVHNLFVANLPFQARGKDLKEFFNAENANVVSEEVIFRENPRGSAGYGFVSFYTKKEADAALSTFDGKMFMGRPIRVAPSKRFLRQETKASLESEDTSTNVTSEEAQTETSDEV